MTTTHEHPIIVPAEPTEAKLFNSLGSGQIELSPYGHGTGQTDETGNTVIDLTKTDVENLFGETERENRYDMHVESLLTNEKTVEKTLSTSQESVFANSFLSGIRETPLNFEDNDLSAFFTYRGGSKFNIAAQSTPKKLGETKCKLPKRVRVLNG